MNLKLNSWNATAFFQNLVARNKFATAHGFTFARVSGLEGFEEALQNMQSTTAFVCVSDMSQGYIALANTPRTRRVKTIFLAMRHAIDDMEARLSCMETLREVFRQFMSMLILERTRLEQSCIYLDERITFNEIRVFLFGLRLCLFSNCGGHFHRFKMECG